MSWTRLTLVALLLSCFVRPLSAQQSAEPSTPLLPQPWQQRWDNPATEDRPLQIVHGMHINPALTGEPRLAAAGSFVERLQQHGLGGMVCNMPFQNYRQAEQDWETLAHAIAKCRDLGLVVWLYDEEGYPSGAAGHLVLNENPDFEATELAYDAKQAEPFVIRKSYEFTHANNNYHASRRYTNLIDDQAMNCFVKKTHDAYWDHLQPFFGSTIEAMFTDEPSLLAVSLGQIPEEARKNVTIIDKPDPSVRPLPAVPWCHDLPDQYRQRFGEDILQQRLSLFVGNTDEDRRVRRQFWELISDLIADRYFGKLQGWCEEHKVASSGHTLFEESLINQVAGEGNGLKALRRMHVPGLDMLSSDPEVVIYVGWLTAGLPASAAMHTSGRRIMTEVSDFSQKMGNQGPASLTAMEATAAWQATWGVTDFTLYYGMQDRSQDEYQAYATFVGRMNAILKPAAQRPQVLLYYPIRDLWAEYLPTAERLSMTSQSPRAQRIVQSFMRLGELLQQNQIPFAVVDHEFLARAQVEPQGSIRIGNNSYRGLVLPAGVELPSDAMAIVDRADKASSSFVIRDGIEGQAVTADMIRQVTSPNYRLTTASPRIALGRFQRDGHDILLLVNVGKRAYDAALVTPASTQWARLDPHSGDVSTVPSNATGEIPLQLEPHQTCLLIGSGN